MEEIEAINTEAMKRAAIEKELENKVRVWEKNRFAFLDLVGLIYVLKTSIGGSVSGASLFYRVLNNLKDPEITVAWKGKSLYEEYRKLRKELDSIAEQYSKLIPEGNSYFARFRSMSIDEYMFESRIVDKDGNSSEWYDEPYNLMASLTSFGQIKWIRELLTSDISSNRVEMLDDIIKNTKIEFTSLVAESNYPDSVYAEVWECDNYKEKQQESINKMNDLVKAWIEEKVTDEAIKRELLRKMKKANLKFLQENSIIDFTSDLIFLSSYGDVATPAQIYYRDNDGIYYFDSFYDTESYQKLPEEIRQNTDKFLIHSIVKRQCHELDRLIQLQNFKVTDENIREIISAVSSNYENAKYSINKICETIEKKAKTPKEYRKAKQYTGQIRDALDPEKLKQQRQELLIRLINMNESLQEQVPGKMKIKDIPFQVENK